MHAARSGDVADSIPDPFGDGADPSLDPAAGAEFRHREADQMIARAVSARPEIDLLLIGKGGLGAVPPRKAGRRRIGSDGWRLGGEDVRSVADGQATGLGPQDLHDRSVRILLHLLRGRQAGLAVHCGVEALVDQLAGGPRCRDL